MINHLGGFPRLRLRGNRNYCGALCFHNLLVFKRGKPLKILAVRRLIKFSVFYICFLRTCADIKNPKTTSRFCKRSVAKSSRLPRRTKSERNSALFKCGVSFGGNQLALIEQKTNNSLLI